MDNPPYQRLGLVAGRGRYPLLFCEAAKARGVPYLLVTAMRGETDPAIEELADEVVWIHVGQVGKSIKAFRKREVPQVVFAGQIKPGRLFGDLRPDLRAIKLLASLKLKNAESIFGGLAAEYEKDGISVLPATTCLEDFLAVEGQMGKIKAKGSIVDDIDLGWRIARQVSQLDIGQTVVVKNGTVLAVEGFEGTDQAIVRGGELGNGGVTVVKVAKPDHDMRFDVPCIGTTTVRSLLKAEAVALAVQAGKTLFLDKPDVLAELDSARIAVIGRTASD